MRKRIIAAWIAIAACCWPAFAQGIDSRNACGASFHVFADFPHLPDPALGSLPAAQQRRVETTIRPLLAKEAKITGADSDGSKIDDVKDALRVHRIGRDAKGKELYAAWWNIPAICGPHGNCPIWLLGLDAKHAVNLGLANEPNNPAATIGTGWGVAVLPSPIPYERLMTVARGFASPGHPDAEGICWRRHGDTYISDPCPPTCMNDLNRSNR